MSEGKKTMTEKLKISRSNILSPNRELRSPHQIFNKKWGGTRVQHSSPIADLPEDRMRQMLAKAWKKR